MTAPSLLQLDGISKRFAGVQALANVSLALRAGEVHALMGQNGAGKSTLIKVLTGVYAPDTGRMQLDGRDIRPATPQQAQALGMSTVYQEVNLCPNLSVAENVFAGRYPRRGLLAGRGVDWPRMNEDARKLLARLHLDLDVTRPLASFPVAVQQMVAIARALRSQSRVLVLDEPTSSLDGDEVQRLFEVLRKLRGEGLAILFVTHFLDEVYAIADRITVLRNGERVGEWTTAELDAPALVGKMIGREFVAAGAGERAVDAASGRPVLAARGIARRAQVGPLDLELRAGEVLGLAGLLGSGRTELARLLFGLDRADAGTLAVDGEEVAIDSPSQAVRLGFAMCPEDRKAEGIVADLSIRENIALALQARLGLVRCLGARRQQQLADKWIAELGIKATDAEMPMGQLSGGNQQKALLARWLATDPRLLILDEPTRGIDVAAKQDIMQRVVALAREGRAVLFISSELDEIARVADRIAVMRDRRKAGELPGGSDERAICDVIAGGAAA